MRFRNGLTNPCKRVFFKHTKTRSAAIKSQTWLSKWFFPVLLRNCFFICCFGLLSGCFAHGYNLREGIRSFQIQNYRQAFIRLLPEAEKGQRDAKYAVGYMYYYGQGVIEDRIKAGYWINSAARAGQPDAIQAVGIIETQR
jgi:hypothetical protein